MLSDGDPAVMSTVIGRSVKEKMLSFM